MIDFSKCIIFKPIFIESGRGRVIQQEVVCSYSDKHHCDMPKSGGYHCTSFTCAFPERTALSLRNTKVAKSMSLKKMTLF